MKERKSRKVQRTEETKQNKTGKNQLRASENLPTRKSEEARITKITREMDKTDVRMFTQNRGITHYKL